MLILYLSYTYRYYYVESSFRIDYIPLRSKFDASRGDRLFTFTSSRKRMSVVMGKLKTWWCWWRWKWWWSWWYCDDCHDDDCDEDDEGHDDVSDDDDDNCNNYVADSILYHCIHLYYLSIYPSIHPSLSTVTGISRGKKTGICYTKGTSRSMTDLL